jgi:hypothetical protein
MLRVFLAALLCAAFHSAAARADVAAAEVNHLGTSCRTFTLCSAHNANTVCTGAGSDQIVANVVGFREFAFASHKSDSTAYSCAIVSNLEGHDGADPDADGSTLATLSNTTRQAGYSGALQYLFASCSGVSGGTTTHVTIEVLACY